MTPDLWKAKKIIDSTLHPGTIATPRIRGDKDEHVLQIPASQSSSRSACHASSSPILSSRPACSSLTSVYVSLSSSSHPKINGILSDRRNAWLANNKPISQCRNQQRERQQDLSLEPVHPRKILPDGCHSLLRCCSRLELPRPATEATVTHRSNYIGASCSVRCCRLGRRGERVLDARRRDQERNRRLSSTQRGRKKEYGERGQGAGEPGQKQEGCDACCGRDGGVQGHQCNTCHGRPAVDLDEATEDGLAEESTATDDTSQSW